MKLESVRREYNKASLSKSDLGSEPFKLFDRWLKEAFASNPNDANSMALITLGIDGFPQSRIVLLKNFSTEGFTFYTNYNSQKGIAIAKDNHVGLHFFWPELERQVRISGYAEKTSREDSMKYFHSRPQDSQIAAAISDQSTEIPDRNYLQNKFQSLKTSLKNKNPDCPINWGGYLVRPVKFEFWQGRENRLHDRIVFEKNELSWVVKRLAP